MIKTPLSTVIGGAFWTPGATVINGAKLSFEIVMKKLFANGEQGFWYDPSDMGTMYQDAAGTVPITAVGQPVGLMLDKSKGAVLGPELIKNPTFEDRTVWEDTSTGTGFIAPINGVLRVSGTSGTDRGRVQQSFATVIGKTYKFESDGEFLSGGVGNITLGVATAPNGGGTRFFVSSINTGFIFTAASSSTYVYLATNAVGAVVDLAKVSVREVPGNRAYQTTSAARPILQNTPRRIDFDAVDDKLITNLPAQLTDCTVIRSVPGVGAQILTGQTIPVTYEDNKDHCGLIAINRALTASETAAITREFNKRAGM